MKRDTRNISIIFAFSVLIGLRMIMNEGYFSVITEDAFTYTTWADQFHKSLTNGILYPRWIERDFWGFGSPVFILYSPMAYFLTSLVASLTASITLSMNILKMVSIFVAGTGIYFVVREDYQPEIALKCAIFYVLIPFNAFFNYYFGTFSTTLAISIIPFIILFMLKYIKNSNSKQAYIASILFSLLLLTHIITAYMVAFVVLIVMLLNWNRIDIIKHITICILLVFGFSAPYILPLLAEIRYFKVENFIDSEPLFDYKYYFYDLSGLQVPNDVWNTYSYVFFSNFGFALLVCIISLAVVLLTKSKTQKIQTSTCMISVLVFTLFVQISYSVQIWESMPFFKYIQFPFRWLVITLIFSSIAISIFIEKVHIYFGFKFSTFLFSAIFIIFGVIDYNIITKSFIFRPNILDGRGINRTIEHLPKNIDIDRLKQASSYLPISSSEKKANIRVILSGAEEKIYDITSESPHLLRLKILYFPGWNAYVDGHKTAIGEESGTGAMLISFPKGEHTLKVVFEDTFDRILGKAIFIATLLALTGYSIFTKRLKSIASNLH